MSLLLGAAMCLVFAAAAFAAGEPQEVWSLELTSGSYPRDVKVDSGNNVIVLTTGENDVLYKVSPAGVLLWQTQISSGNQACAVTVMPDDSIIVGGTNLLAAYTSEGSAIWSENVDFRVRTLTHDADGNLFVAGDILYSGPVRVEKRNAAGYTLWSTVEPLPENARFLNPIDIFVDDAGVVSLVSWTSYGNPWFYHYVTTYDDQGNRLSALRGFGYPTDSAMSVDGEITIVGGIWGGPWFGLIGAPNNMTGWERNVYYRGVAYTRDGGLVIGVVGTNGVPSSIRKVGEWEYPIEGFVGGGIAIDTTGAIFFCQQVYSETERRYLFFLTKLTDGAATVEALIATIEDIVAAGGIDSQGLSGGMISLLEGALEEQANPTASVNKLEAFINKVRAQSGKQIDEENATLFIDIANRVIAEM